MNFCAQTPFWANNHSDMYVRVLQDELTFPEDKAMDQDTKSLIRGVCPPSIVLERIVLTAIGV